MYRTSILLPARLKRVAARRARSLGLSFGEFVRRAIEKAVRETASRRDDRDPLWRDRAVFRGPVPADLSTRHDYYLYGEES